MDLFIYFFVFGRGPYRSILICYVFGRGPPMDLYYLFMFSVLLGVRLWIYTISVFVGVPRWIYIKFDIFGRGPLWIYISKKCLVRVPYRFIRFFCFW